jgi:hypothetical protein
MASRQRTGGEASHRRRLIDIATRFLAIAFIIQNMSVLFMLHRSPLPTPLLQTSLVTLPVSQMDGMIKPKARENRSKELKSQTHQQPQQQKKNTASTSGRFAYIYLMAGCDPKKKERYIGYVLNILIAKYILRKSGSDADVMVLTRMSSETDDETIPEQELLEKADVIVRYLPKVHTDNFFRYAWMLCFNSCASVLFNL